MNSLLDKISQFLCESVKTPDFYLKDIIKDLEDYEIDYAVIGGISLKVHNFERYTEDINLLVSKEGFKKIQENLIGNRYTLKPGSSKNLYYHGLVKINIDILVEGTKEGSFTLPHPKNIRQKFFGVWYIDLKNLIIFKLNANRTQDLADVSRLILANSLNEKYAKKLPLNIRTKFLELFK
ncbi:MAG: hypothetical protein WC503_02925 [Candidatus Shapirobacteria bacterium]